MLRTCNAQSSTKRSSATCQNVYSTPQPSMHNRQPSKELKQPPTELGKEAHKFFFKRKVGDFQSVTERISHNSITSFSIDAAHTLNKAHRSDTQIPSVSEARTRTKPATNTGNGVRRYCARYNVAMTFAITSSMFDENAQLLLPHCSHCSAKTTWPPLQRNG